ncbi:MAG: hypothetical protein ABI068_09765 [Ktedonobacterales bacterium]
MPRDAMNMPFERPAPYLDANAVTLPFSPDVSGGAQAAQSGAGANIDESVDTQLKAESILLEEFNYASVTAYQAKEDAANLFNLYLLAVGALATGLGVMVNAYSRDTRSQIAVVATMALLIFALLSFAFYARFFDLGQEYSDSLVTMGVIKEFYIQKLKRRMTDIEQAFRWRLRNAPRGGPIGGGNSLISYVIALLGSLAVAGALGEARQVWSISTGTTVSYTLPLFGERVGIPFFWEILTGLLALLGHVVYYTLALRRRERRNREVARQDARRFQLPRLGG